MKLSILFISIGIFLIGTTMADVVQPNYELKFFLSNDKMLKPGTNVLRDSISHYFGVQTCLAIVMEFLDSNIKDLYSEGWIVRVRNREDKKKLDISYKYRIPVMTTITDALKKAESLGWDSSEQKYRYQIDWGYTKKTLSITKVRKKIDVEGVDEEKMELPNDIQARATVQPLMPGKLKKWGDKYLAINQWAKKILSTAHLFGPVAGKRYVGYWSIPGCTDIKVYIEIWNIAGIFVTELSCKVDQYAEAKELHQKIQIILAQNGWLIEKDMLKTRMILNSY